MKRLKIAGLCFAAVLALSAVAVASASAAGELELVNSESKGLVKNHFKGESGESRIESMGGRKITCTKTKFEGVAKNTKEGEVTLTSTGCKSLGVECKTAGAKNGEIVTTYWYFWAWLYVPPNHYDYAYQYSFLPYGTATLAVECSTFEKLALKNGVVAPITEPVELGKLTKEITTLDKEKKGEQEFTKYKLIDSEGAATKEADLEVEGKGLETFAFEKAGLEVPTTKVKFEEEVKFVEN